MWVWVGMVCAASLVVLFDAVEQSGSAVRAGGIAVGFWFPGVTTLLGTLVAVRQPENRIAWLLIGIGFAVLVEFFLQLFLSTEPSSPSSADLTAIVLVHIALPVAIYLAFLIPLMFPSGHFFTRRQALVAWPGAIMLLILPLIVILTEKVGPPFPPKGQTWTVENPVGFLPISALNSAIVSTIVVLFLTAVASVFSLAVRYRRSSVVPRAQIRWILFSTSIVGGVLLILVATDASQNVVGGLLLVAAFVSMPVSVTVAITRYQLFEIDRIIARTLSYALVVAVLGALFFGMVTLVTSLLAAQSSLVVAGATLAVAALFNPLRKRIQRAVDHRFNRSGYLTEVVSEKFTSRLRESLTTDELVEVWGQTVNNALQPEGIGIWIRQDPANPRPGEASAP